LPAKISNQSSGVFVNFNTVKSAANTTHGDTRPYVETKSENRTITRKGAGVHYQNNPSQQISELNAAGEVPFFEIDYNNQLKRNGSYAANTLYKTIVIDEDNKTAAKFTNALGQVVMTTQGSENQTCYVYDNFGLLRYVFPPLAVVALDEGNISDNDITVLDYAYIYKYDEFGRQISKKLPGRTVEPINMFYDKAHRLILVQDGNLKESNNNKWVYTKYDEYGRVLYSGICTLTASIDELREHFNETVVREEITTLGIGYTQNTFLNTEYNEFLSINYYDDYEFLNLDMFVDIKTALNFQMQPRYLTKKATAEGLPTGKVSFVLDNSGNSLKTAIYYNKKGQAAQIRSINYLGGFDILHSSYNFAGNVEKTFKVHSPSPLEGMQNPFEEEDLGGIFYESYQYIYDHAQRLKKTEYTLGNNAPVVLSENVYDNLGRLKTKYRHHRKTDVNSFDYNIKSQFTKIQSGGFVQTFGYQGLYNGNIASIASQNYNYQFYYDELNRLENAESEMGFNEHFTYDNHGNIETLQRYSGGVLIDDLQMFEYRGNQLYKIKEHQRSHSHTHINALKEYVQSAEEGGFEYDKNGNLIEDTDRKISFIEYNVLNLPSKIVFEDGVFFNVYSADAQKLAAIYITDLEGAYNPLHLSLNEVLNNPDFVENSDRTVYLGNFEYRIDRDEVFLKVYNSEGYFFNGDYYYFRKDHLGNVREVWNGTQRQTVQKTDYYPSGLPIFVELEDDVRTANNRLCNGKEFIEMGYDVYDLGFRTYYPAIGRFTAIDPLAEMFYSQSPYVYAANNPVRYIDFLGLAPMESQGWDDFPEMPDLHYIDMDGKFRLTVMPFDVNGINFGGGSGLAAATYSSLFPMYWQSYYDPLAMTKAKLFNDYENWQKRNPERIDFKILERDGYNPYEQRPNRDGISIPDVLGSDFIGGGSKFELNYSTKGGAKRAGGKDAKVGKDEETGEWYYWKDEGFAVLSSDGSIEDIVVDSRRIFDNNGRTTGKHNFKQGYRVWGTGREQLMQNPTAKRILGGIDASALAYPFSYTDGSAATRISRWLYDMSLRVAFFAEKAAPATLDDFKSNTIIEYLDTKGNPYQNFGKPKGENGDTLIIKKTTTHTRGNREILNYTKKDTMIHRNKNPYLY